jgi:hypothetical protein
VHCAFVVAVAVVVVRRAERHAFVNEARLFDVVAAATKDNDDCIVRNLAELGVLFWCEMDKTTLALIATLDIGRMIRTARTGHKVLERTHVGHARGSQCCQAPFSNQLTGTWPCLSSSRHSN